MNINKKWFLFLLFALLLIVMSTAVYADISANYSISKSVVAGGGHQSSTGSYSLAGTVGETAVGTNSNGNYTVNSGFWAGGAVANGAVYLPMIVK